MSPSDPKHLELLLALLRALRVPAPSARQAVERAGEVLLPGLRVQLLTAVSTSAAARAGADPCGPALRRRLRPWVGDAPLEVLGWAPPSATPAALRKLRLACSVTRERLGGRLIVSLWSSAADGPLDDVGRTLLEVIADALGAALEPEPPEGEQHLAAGVLLLDACGRRRGADPGGERLLARLAAPHELWAEARRFAEGDAAELELRLAASQGQVTARLGRVEGHEPGVRVLLQASSPLRAGLRSRAAAAGLTLREQEIACLAALGLGNQEIGLELAISPHTVKACLAGIYTKTGLRGRSRLAAHLLQAPGAGASRGPASAEPASEDAG